MPTAIGSSNTPTVFGFQSFRASKGKVWQCKLILFTDTLIERTVCWYIKALCHTLRWEVGCTSIRSFRLPFQVDDSNGWTRRPSMIPPFISDRLGLGSLQIIVLWPDDPAASSNYLNSPPLCLECKVTWSCWSVCIQRTRRLIDMICRWASASSWLNRNQFKLVILMTNYKAY